MLEKKEIKKLIKNQFEKPVTSTKYIKFQKMNTDYPSYHQLKNLYGSWDNLTHEIWKVGTRNRVWTKEETIEMVLKFCPQPITSTAYQKLRNDNRSFLPTYNVLNDLFGSWGDISEAIWGEKGEPPISWDSLDEMKVLILKYFPTPVNSIAYEKQRKEKQLPLPSRSTLYQHFEEWGDISRWLWEDQITVWTKELIEQTVLAIFPQRVGIDWYRQQRKGRSLPHLYIINQEYGSWDSFSNHLWGESVELTKEDIIKQIRQVFPTRPLQATYEAKLPEHPELMSVFRLERRFGNWESVMKIAYEGMSLETKLPPKKRNEYSDQQLLKVVRDYFSERPSIKQYATLARNRRFLPSKNVLVERFGSWNLAMERCFPQSYELVYRHTWSKEEIRLAVKRAGSELGESFTLTNYIKWRKEHLKDYPSVQTIAKYFGSFYGLLEELGYPVPIDKKRLMPRSKEMEEVVRWMNRYSEELEGNPTTLSYIAFNQKYKEAPSMERLIRLYGTKWTDVVKVFFGDIDTHDFQIYTDEQMKEAIMIAYREIGLPMTRSRYDQFRLTYEKELPISGTISRRFRTWKQAIEGMGIPYFHYTDKRQLLTKDVVALEQEEGLGTLNDVLSWALGD